MPEATPNRFLLTAMGLVLIAALGLLCIIAPTLLAGTPLMTAPLFPLLRTSIEGMSWMSIAALAALGLAAGLATRLPPALIAMASVIALPVAMFFELAADSTSHNLFPFELVMYAALALPPLAMACIGRWLRGGKTAIAAS